VLLISVVDLFTFPHSGNQNRQGGQVKLMWLAAFSSAIFGALMWVHGTLKKSFWA